MIHSDSHFQFVSYAVLGAGSMQILPPRLRLKLCYEVIVTYVVGIFRFISFIAGMKAMLPVVMK